MPNTPDVVTALREIRRMRGFTQKQVAEMSGVGKKTISSFETGHRIGTMKLDQLRALLCVYGITEEQFFSGSFVDNGDSATTQFVAEQLLDARIKCPCGRELNVRVTPKPEPAA